MPGFGVDRRFSVGKMRSRVRIETLSDDSQVDDRGHIIQTWTKLGENVPCSIESVRRTSVRMMLRETGNQLTANATHVIVMRYRDGVEPIKTRLVNGESTYYVASSENIQDAGRFLLLLVEEKR